MSSLAPVRTRLISMKVSEGKNDAHNSVSARKRRLSDKSQGSAGAPNVTYAELRVIGLAAAPRRVHVLY